MRWIKWFLAGALAVPLAHQVMLSILNAAGLVDRAPFAMEATKPFGVPAVVSLAFWGGVWGVILLVVVGRLRGAKFWTVSILFGAIAPTLVAGFVVAPLKGQPAGGNAKMAMVGFLVNAAWALGTVVLAKAMEGWRATSRNSRA
jgi:hypothetical protein